MLVDPDWLPYEIVDKDKNFKGIAADLIYLIADRAGITLELIYTENWSQTLEYSKQGKAFK